MYNNIKHRKDITYVSKIVSDTVLSLPIHPFMTQGENRQNYQYHFNCIRTR